MNLLGAKIYTAIIKNLTKRQLIYRMLTDSAFSNRVAEQEQNIEQALYYVHNYLTKPNLVVVHLVGGLGNQMNLYVFGKALQHKGFDVVFDARVGGYKGHAKEYLVMKEGGGNFKKSIKIRNLELINFDISLPIDLNFDKELFFDLVDKDRAKIPANERLKYPYKFLMNSEQVYSLDNIAPYTYFNGYGNVSYLKLLHSEIRKDFQLKVPLSPSNTALKKHILDTQDSIFLHIRRGDYLVLKHIYVQLGGKYYSGAITHIKSKIAKPHIFVFSNDIVWCERQFLATLSDECKKGVGFEFVVNNGEGNAAQEMELMRSCQHAIIANSTFSWWAGYLIDNPNKIVLAPNNDGTNFILQTY